MKLNGINGPSLQGVRLSYTESKTDGIQGSESRVTLEELKLERYGPCLLVSLSCPENLNAFSLRMGQEIIHTFYECERDGDIKSIILTGEGRAFCSGGNIKDMERAAQDRKGEFLKEIAGKLNRVVTAMRRVPKIVIAAVNGVASGAGFSLALASDLIVAADNARFNLAHRNVGLHPDGGAVYFLEHTIGVYKTRELVYRGSVLDAVTAEKLNIVNRVVTPEELKQEALALGRELSEGPNIAMGLAKRTIDLGLNENLDAHLENERQAIARTGETQDHIEGLRAFSERRRPMFKGR